MDNTPQPNQALHPKADVLIVTVTKFETQAVLERFQQETGQNATARHIGTKTYFELGVLLGATIYLVQSEMGTGGPGGALLTVDEAIRTLSPSSVVMVGIAFGFDEKKFAIGDILVSRQLLGYELQKVATSHGQETLIPRGDRPHASPRLLSRFESGSLSWQAPPQVEFGLILSGEKLVDNRTFRESLRTFALEALGGEMEGSGLYAAAHLRKTDWLLVKAICDWADGDKGHDKASRQKRAAENAARFTIHVLGQGGFVDSPETSSSQTGEKGYTTSQTPSVGTCLYTYDVHANWVSGVDWSPTGIHIASAAGDGTVHIWEADTGRTLLTYRSHTTTVARITLPAAVHTIRWSPEGLRIASGGTGSKVYVWNAATGQTLSVYPGHSGMMPNVYTLAWSPDGTYIASACSSIGMDKTIHIWNVANEQLNKRFDAGHGLLPNFDMFSLAWSPDGTCLAANVFGDKAIRTWDITTGRQISTTRTDAGSVSGLAWSPDGRRLASAHFGGLARVWDIQTGASIAIYRGHSDQVRSIAWSPDGARIATASYDKTVQLWDAATGNHIYTYKGHSDWVVTAAWSPDSTRLASGSNDKTVQIWQAKT